MILTLLRMQKEFHVMNVAGESGREYQFTWNQATGRYEFVPRNQQEIDDLFATSSPYSFVYFAPVLETKDAPVPAARPTIERAQYDMLTRPDLVALAKNCGLSVRAGDDDLTVKRLLDCYFIGQGVKEEMAKSSTVPPVDTPDLELDATPQTKGGKARRQPA